MACLQADILSVMILVSFNEVFCSKPYKSLARSRLIVWRRFSKPIRQTYKFIENYDKSYKLCCLPVSTLLVAIRHLVSIESRAVKSAGVNSG